MFENQEKPQNTSEDVKTVEGDVIVMGAGPVNNGRPYLDRLITAAQEQAAKEVFYGPLEAIRVVESNSHYWKGPFVLTNAYRREAFRTSGVTFQIPKEKEPPTGMFVHFEKTSKGKDAVELRARTSDSRDLAFGNYECMTRVVFMKPVLGQYIDPRTNTLVVNLGDEEVRLHIKIVSRSGWQGSRTTHFTGFVPDGDFNPNRLRCMFK